MDFKAVLGIVIRVGQILDCSRLDVYISQNI
jgi:hypothetical protein